MRTKLFISALVVGAGLAFSPLAFAQTASPDNWIPIAGDHGAILNFFHDACVQNPQEVNCVGMQTPQPAPAVAAAPAKRAYRR